MLNLQGWLYGLPYWPVERLFGVVVAWNSVVLLSYVLAGGATCWWLRSLGLQRGAALLGGLAFALAPYRVMQSTGHLLGMMAFLLPLALLGFERGRDGEVALAHARRCGARRRPAHGTASPRARRDPLRARLCAVARAGAPRARRRSDGRRPRGGGRPRRPARGDQRLGRVGRPLAAARWPRLLGRLERLRVAPRRPARGVHAARLADAAPGRGGLRGADRAALAAGLPRCSGIGVDRRRPCSRSAPTSRCTSSSGTTSRRSATRASRSGSCRSPASRSPRWPRSPSTSCARPCSPHWRSWRSRRRPPRRRVPLPAGKGGHGERRVHGAALDGAPVGCSSCRSSSPSASTAPSTSRTASRRRASGRAATRARRREAPSGSPASSSR